MASSSALSKLRQISTHFSQEFHRSHVFICFHTDCTSQLLRRSPKKRRNGLHHCKLTVGSFISPGRTIRRPLDFSQGRPSGKKLKKIGSSALQVVRLEVSLMDFLKTRGRRKSLNIEDIQNQKNLSKTHPMDSKNSHSKGLHSSHQDELLAAADADAAQLRATWAGGLRPRDPPDMVERLGHLMALLGPRLDFGRLAGF